MQKFVVAFDSFKGCMSSDEANRAAERGILSACDHACIIEKLPVSDGGEGILEALGTILDGHSVEVDTCDALRRPLRARYLVSADGLTACIESAAACGLTLLTPDERNPMKTDTYGVGLLIRDAVRRGCEHLIVGLGGSATNDGGMGMLQALGVEFRDRDGIRIEGASGADLERVAEIDSSRMLSELREVTLTAACDVDNPLWGERGAAVVYAPQKGADVEMVGALDGALRHYGECLDACARRNVSQLPGAGAAGGLGAALCGVLGARLESGARLMLETLDFDRIIAGARCIFTGEGASDAQTLMGKIPGEIARTAAQYGIPTILVSGTVAETAALNEAGFAAVFSIQSAPVSLVEAMEKFRAEANLQRVISQIIRLDAVLG